MTSSQAGVPIQRRCMRDEIRDVIVTRILDGSYVAGERLIELNLAREFKVSQTPVREALRELEALGLVKSERYCGTHVRSANATELKQSYELRAVLEERAAQLAVPCTPQALLALQNTLSGMRAAAAAGDTAVYAQQAIHFHRKIVEQSGNRVFLQTWDTLHMEVRARIVALHLGGELPSYADAHELILNALRDGDGKRAGRLLRDLIERLLATLA
jgi:DNA-binding GntR family transcriptional regulator